MKSTRQNSIFVKAKAILNSCRVDEVQIYKTIDT